MGQQLKGKTIATFQSQQKAVEKLWEDAELVRWLRWRLHEVRSKIFAIAAKVYRVMAMKSSRPSQTPSLKGSSAEQPCHGSKA